MSDTLAIGKSASKNPGTAAAFWVLFSMLFVALLIANATAVFYQRKWHRQLAPLRTEVAKLNAKVQQLEDLRTLASKKLYQEKEEFGAIRSMLKTVRSAADMPIDPAGKMHWTPEDRWLGDDGRYSVFFSVPSGMHTFKATIAVMKMVNPLEIVEAPLADLPTEEFNVVLKPNAAYEMRVQRLENTDAGCSFSLQLLDQNKDLLKEREFRSQTKYDSMYSVRNGGGGSADLNSGRRATELLFMYLTCPCPGELTNGFAIGCSVLSEMPKNFMDVLRLVNFPGAATMVSDASPAAPQDNGSASQVPTSSRYIRLDR